MKVPQQLGRQVRVCVSPVFTKSQVAGIIRLIINEEDDDPMCVCVPVSETKVYGGKTQLTHTDTSSARLI